MDVYAMGVILYEVVPGTYPVDGVLRAVQWHLHRAPRPLREHDRRSLPGLVALVLRAMDKDPERRSTMQALADGLQHAVSLLAAPVRHAAYNLLARYRLDRCAPAARYVQRAREFGP